MSPYTHKTCEAIISRAKEYNHFCKKVQSHPEVRVNLKPKLFTERTVAHFVDVYIEQQMQGEYTLISECSIHCAVNEKTKEKAKSEILDKNQDIESFDRKYYIPDTVLIPKTSNKPILFIEYKSNKKFQYYQLAIDYLKYKFYSSALKCHSTFIYVMFYEDNASRLNIIPSKETVHLIRSLKKENSFKGKSIFIFENTPRQFTNTVYGKILPPVNEADKAIAEIEPLKTNYKNVSEMEEDPFYQNYRSFGKDVITAKIIQENFSKIDQIKAKLINDECPNKIDLSKSMADYKITVEDLSNIDKSSDKYKSDCEKIAKHFNSQINIIFKTKIEAMPKILSVHKRKSIWILVLIQKFISDLDINDIELKTSLPKDEREDYSNLLNAYYKNNKQNLHSLCIGLIFYITKLYPIIFKISENNIILGQKDTFTFIYNQKKLNEAINKIRKKLKLKTKINLLNTESQLDFTKEILNYEI